MKFIDAWHFLRNHKIFNVTEVLISPTPFEILDRLGLTLEDNCRLESRHSHFERALTILVLDSEDNEGDCIVCLEAGEVMIGEGGELETVHDYDLDVSASTFEEAVIQLAAAVTNKYGTDVKGSQLTREKKLR